MNKELLQSNIIKFYIYSFFSQFVIFAPILVPFWKSAGLSMTQITLIASFYGATVALLEVPTGTFADRFGEKLSINLGGALLIFAAILYAYSSSFVHFLIAEFFWALSRSLMSGADSALLYNTLEGLDQKSLFNKVQGNAKFLQIIGTASAMFLTGFVAAKSLRMTFLFTAVFFVVSLIFTLKLKEPRHYRKVVKQSYFKILSETRTFVKKHKLVKWYIIFSAIIGSFGSIFWVFYQEFFQYINLDITYFGILFGLYNVAAALFSKYAEKIIAWLNVRTLLILMSICALLPVIAMPAIGGYIVLFTIFAHQFNRGVMKIFFPSEILKFTYDNKRATVLSLTSLLTTFICAIVTPILGYSYDKIGFDSFYIYTIIMSIVFLVMFVYYSKIPEKYFIDKNTTN